MATIDRSRFLQPIFEIVPLSTITPDKNRCYSCFGLYTNASPPADNIAFNRRRLQGCGHIFCLQCIDNWFADKLVCGCPLCRYQYNPVRAYPVGQAPPPPPPPPPPAPLNPFVARYGVSIGFATLLACFFQLLVTVLSELGVISSSQALQTSTVLAIYLFMWIHYRFLLFVAVVLFWLIAPYS